MVVGCARNMWDISVSPACNPVRVTGRMAKSDCTAELRAPRTADPGCTAELCASRTANPLASGAGLNDTPASRIRKAQMLTSLDAWGPWFRGSVIMSFVVPSAPITPVRYFGPSAGSCPAPAATIAARVPQR